MKETHAEELMKKGKVAHHVDEVLRASDLPIKDQITVAGMVLIQLSGCAIHPEDREQFIELFVSALRSEFQRVDAENKEGKGG